MLVCLGCWLRRSLDLEGRFRKYPHGFFGYFLSTSIRHARVGGLRVDDDDVCDGEEKWLN